MYQLDSSYQWKASTQTESKAVAIPLSQGASESESNSELTLANQPINLVTDLPECSEINVVTKVAKTASEQQLEQILSNLLKYGVFLASAIVFVGGVLYLLRHGMEPASYQVFRGEPSEFRSPEGVVKAISSGSRRGIIQLGLLVLIATPIIRVATSLLFFLRQRDFTYTIVTLLVMAALVYSVLGAYY